MSFYICKSQVDQISISERGKCTIRVTVVLRIILYHGTAKPIPLKGKRRLAQAEVETGSRYENTRGLQHFHVPLAHWRSLHDIQTFSSILRVWIARTQTGHMCCSPLCKVTIISATLETTTQLFIRWGQRGISLKCKIFIKTSSLPGPLLVVSPSNCSPASIILQFLNHHLPAAPHLLLYQAPPNLRLQCILEASGKAFEVYQPFHLGAAKTWRMGALGKMSGFFVERKRQFVVGTPWGFGNFTSSVRFLRMSCTKTSRKALTLPLFRPTNHENAFFVPITFQKEQMPIFLVQKLRKRFETCITTKWINPFTKRVKFSKHRGENLWPSATRHDVGLQVSELRRGAHMLRGAVWW